MPRNFHHGRFLELKLKEGLFAAAVVGSRRGRGGDRRGSGVNASRARINFRFLWLQRNWFCSFCHQKEKTCLKKNLGKFNYQKII